MRLLEAGHLLTFSASRMGTSLRWALIQGWALIQINMVSYSTLPPSVNGKGSNTWSMPGEC